MKLKNFLMSCAAACTIATSAMAEGGMFEQVLPENMKADVVAAVKYNYYNFSNWEQDGTSNYTWIVTFDADVQNQWKVTSWRNLIDIDLGQTWTKGLGKRKSSDRLFWESMLDFNVTEILKPYIGNRFETQMMAGYAYSEDADGNEVKKAVSSFMDPAYETQVAGLAFIPSDMFNLRVAFANRMTISDGYGYADDPDTKKFEKLKDEPGLEGVAEFKYNLYEAAAFKSRLWTFVNFEGVEEIDGKWENLLTVTLAPYIELQVGFDMAYDLDQDEDAQYKTMVLFGLTWKMF